MNSFQLSTPVAFIIFNRPDTTARVFEAIRRAEPPQLLIVADGPRVDRPSDVERCAAARAVIERVDWDCEVLTNYAEANMGLADRVSSGLDWVFSLCDRAIVLEDDCLPDPSFFRFCDELLDRYRDDERVMAISGDNFQLGRRRTRYSYYLSRYNHCWGWATWRRGWQHYDHRMQLWPLVRDGGWLCDILDSDRAAVRYWSRIFQAVYEGQVSSWAYRWTLSCWAQGGLTVLPSVNLVSNIGYGASATHTRGKGPGTALPAQSVSFPLTHPLLMVRDAQADRFTQARHFGTGLGIRMVRRVRALLRRFGRE